MIKHGFIRPSNSRLDFSVKISLKHYYASSDVFAWYEIIMFEISLQTSNLVKVNLYVCLFSKKNLFYKKI